MKTLCIMIVWLAFKEKRYYQLQRLKQQQIRRFKLKSGIAIKVLPSSSIYCRKADV